MRGKAVRDLSALPERAISCRDAEGYVYHDVPVSEAADEGWIELSPAQVAHVRPLTELEQMALAGKRPRRVAPAWQYPVRWALRLVPGAR